MVSTGRVERFALDPVLNRPLGMHPVVDRRPRDGRYLHVSGGRRPTAARSPSATGRTPGRTPRAKPSEAPAADPVAEPLTADQVAPSADGCVVVVLAAEDRAQGRGDGPVWVDGVGWSQDAPSLESRDWDRAVYAERAAVDAFRRAEAAPSDVDLAEVDDRFAYKQLQHLDAMGLAELPAARVNASGGALGEGNLHEANGLARVLACVERLRAGDARVAVAQAWRGIPSASGAVAVLRRG